MTLPPPPYPSQHDAVARPRRTSTLVAVIAAQWAAVTGFATFLVVGVALFARAEAAPESFAALVSEQIAGLLPLVAVLCAVHLAVVVGLLRERRWGILLLALVSVGYAGFAVAALISGSGRSAEAQQSVLTLAAIGLIALVSLNALAFVNWRHTR